MRQDRLKIIGLGNWQTDRLTNESFRYLFEAETSSLMLITIGLLGCDLKTVWVTY